MRVSLFRCSTAAARRTTECVGLERTSKTTQFQPLCSLQEPKHIKSWTKHPLARDAGPGSPTSCHNGEAMGHTGSGSISPSGSEDDQKGQRKSLILHLAWGTPNTWQRASGISSRRFRISPAGQARQGADCRGTGGEQRDRATGGPEQPQPRGTSGPACAPPCRARSGAAERSLSLRRPLAGAPQSA